MSVCRILRLSGPGHSGSLAASEGDRETEHFIYTHPKYAPFDTTTAHTPSAFATRRPFTITPHTIAPFTIAPHTSHRARRRGLFCKRRGIECCVRLRHCRGAWNL